MKQDNINHHGPSYWLQGSIHRVGELALIGMERHRRVLWGFNMDRYVKGGLVGLGFGYGWLLWVQSVTWAAIVGCPCDWWLVLSCFTLVTLPPCGYCLEASMTGPAAPRPVVSRLRGNDGRFWKGLLDGRGPKPVPVPDTGTEGDDKTNPKQKLTITINKHHHSSQRHSPT